MEYKRLYDSEKVELISYVNNWLELKPNTEILIGCDSQNFSDKTIYAIVVALYDKGKGAHVLYNRWKTQREPTRNIRLLNEVWYAHTGTNFVPRVDSCCTYRASWNQF